MSLLSPTNSLLSVVHLAFIWWWVSSFTSWLHIIMYVARIWKSEARRRDRVVVGGGGESR